ncbi:hypothetical protein FBEOM_12881 [Fusarium beomiforme]|uniref:Uncharacterized protein n=1 Tax=Fusarium beomiforme TaxID=44412 RepID=A0A9P5DS27_9HYPO|nr:hypothetical protein FBEOM_12881 [Fusarium beomiforme]
MDHNYLASVGQNGFPNFRSLAIYALSRMTKSFAEAAVLVFTGTVLFDAYLTPAYLKFHIGYEVTLLTPACSLILAAVFICVSTIVSLVLPHVEGILQKLAFATFILVTFATLVLFELPILSEPTDSCVIPALMVLYIAALICAALWAILALIILHTISYLELLFHALTFVTCLSMITGALALYPASVEYRGSLYVAIRYFSSCPATGAICTLLVAIFTYFILRWIVDMCSLSSGFY